MTDRDQIRAKLAELMEAETGASADLLNGPEDVSLREGLAVDSVDLIGVVMRIEEFYRIRLSRDDLERVITVRDLVDVIQAQRVAAAAAA